MAATSATGIAGLNQIKPTEGLGKSQGAGAAGKAADAADFRRALNDALSPAGGTSAGAGVPTTSGAPAPLAAKGVGATGAGAVVGGAPTTNLDAIRAQMPTAASLGATSLKFSNHSLERMHSRGISYSPEQMKSIENAVAKAAAKGSKDTLVLTDSSALIVSVKNGTVVTVMDRAAMKENVFTNIDSTVMA